MLWFVVVREGAGRGANVQSGVSAADVGDVGEFAVAVAICDIGVEEVGGVDNAGDVVGVVVAAGDSIGIEGAGDGVECEGVNDTGSEGGVAVDGGVSDDNVGTVGGPTAVVGMWSRWGAGDDSKGEGDGDGIQVAIAVDVEVAVCVPVKTQVLWGTSGI